MQNIMKRPVSKGCNMEHGSWQFQNIMTLLTLSRFHGKHLQLINLMYSHYDCPLPCVLPNNMIQTLLF